MAGLLGDLTEGSVGDVEDLATGSKGTPVFVVAGGCPNSFCGMQAVVYAQMEGAAQRLDFWWIKPSAVSPSVLEQSTLNRHAKGPHKNDPGRSKAVYGQFADLFTGNQLQQEKVGAGKLNLGLITVDGRKCAYIEQRGTSERYYIYLIWQEFYTTNPLARSKCVTGQLVYQRSPTSSMYFARPYEYRDGVLSVPADAPAVAFGSALPPDRIKLG